MIIGASVWGRELRGTPPRSGAVNALTVHWVGSSSYGRPQDLIGEGIKQIEQGQFRADPKLSAISYNFLVDKWGRIWEGRGYGYRNAANGAKANNATSMSVCVLVGKSDATPTVETVAGLRWLYRDMVARFGQVTVQGHCDVRATACPGPELVRLVRSGEITDGGAVTRIAGNNRYETSVAVSRVAFPDGAGRVFVVSGTGFADALSASALVSEGPILLTDPNRLPPEVAAEIRRLRPSEIVIVGGPSAVSAAVEVELGRLV
jgi:hypothetical protein